MLPRDWCHRIKAPGRSVDLVIGGTLLLVTPLLFFGGPDLFSSRLFQSTWSLGHLVLFAVVALGVVRVAPAQWTWKTLWLVTLGVAALTGGLAEIVQGLFGRTPSFIDWSWDLLGAAAGLVLVRVLPRNPVAGLLIGGTVFLLVASILAPRLIIAVDDATAARQFPVLATFETPFELTRWVGRDYLSIQTAAVHAGEHSLKVILPPGLYSGTSFSHFPRDWSGYRVLEFHAFNPIDEPLPIVINLYDQRHVTLGQRYSDRYNGRRTLLKGWNRIEVDLEQVRTAPSQREMDLTHIHNLQIFTAGLKQQRTIYLDQLQLLR